MIFDLDEEGRTAALSRTDATLKELVRICRASDVPVAMLPQIVELYNASAREVVFERRRAEAAERVSRLMMTITSMDQCWKPMRLKRGETAEVITRPQCAAYRVEEIEILGDPNRWLVHEIKVGSRSQFMKLPYPIRGEAFRKGGIMSDVRLNVCLTAMDFAVYVEYVGPVDDGEVFEAVCVGTAAE